jgi:hypothetical protein
VARQAGGATAMTSNGRAPLDRVRTPHPRSCRGPPALANDASGHSGRASPSGGSLGPLPPRRSHCGPRRPCPPRARSIGNWRSLTVNNGRSTEVLTCGIGVASGHDDGAGRAFQARDQRGHELPDRSGQHRSLSVCIAAAYRRTSPDAAGPGRASYGATGTGGSLRAG